MAAEHSPVPIINGGDGAREHPTQTLTDLFTIHRFKGQFDGLKVAFCGDLCTRSSRPSLATPTFVSS